MLRRFASHLPHLAAALATTVAFAAHAVIPGDVDQNGQVEALDLAALRGHFDGTYTLPSFDAANVAPLGAPDAEIDAEDFALLFAALSQEDFDGDGLTASEELAAGTSPLAVDSDGDGLGDLIEVFATEDYGSAFGATVDPTLQNTDGVGPVDGLEDFDGDGLVNQDEYGFGSDPTNPDIDGDGLCDGAADVPGVCIGGSEGGEFGYGTDPFVSDTDGDGLSDGLEVGGANPTDPRLEDTDNDGLCDGLTPGLVDFEDAAGPLADDQELPLGTPFTISTAFGDVTFSSGTNGANVGRDLTVLSSDASRWRADGSGLVIDLPVPVGTVYFQLALAGSPGESAGFDVFQGVDLVGRIHTSADVPRPVYVPLHGPGTQLRIQAVDPARASLLIDNLSFSKAVVANLEENAVPAGGTLNLGGYYSAPGDAFTVAAPELWAASPGYDGNPFSTESLHANFTAAYGALSATSGRDWIAAELGVPSATGTNITVTFRPAFLLDASGAPRSLSRAVTVTSPGIQRFSINWQSSDTLTEMLLQRDGGDTTWLALDNLASATDPSCVLGEDVDLDGNLDTGESDPAAADSDGDGFEDGIEVKETRTVPALADSDGDGMTDTCELTPNSFLGPLLFDPNDPADGGEDLDADGLDNAGECENGTNPELEDTDGDTLWDGAEVHTHGTDPLLADTDGDDLPDDWEVYHGFDAVDHDDRNLDPDADGLTNFDEFNLNLDPTDSDVDDDLLLDGEEIMLGSDPFSDTDSDGDGFEDGVEYHQFGTHPMVANADRDGDGIPDAGDNCLLVANNDQADGDGDGVGDACDRCRPGEVAVGEEDDHAFDPDHDGLCGAADACPTWPSAPGDASACVCGDLNDDGSVTEADRDLYDGYRPDYVGATPTGFWDIDAPHKCDMDGDGLCTPADAAFVVSDWPTGQSSWTPPAGVACADYAAVVEHALNRTGAGGDPLLRRRIWALVAQRIEDLGLFDGVNEWLKSQVGGGAAPLPSSPEIERRLPADYGATAQYPVYGLEAGELSVVYNGVASDGPRRVPGDLGEMKILRHLYSATPLEETLLDLWFNRMNVFAGDGRPTWAIQDYEQGLRDKLWGSYEDLLEASMKGVAMLDYLNLNESKADDPNENYARELMELHTLGVGNFVEDDVTSATLLLTGNTTSTPSGGPWTWIFRSDWDYDFGLLPDGSFNEDLTLQLEDDDLQFVFSEGAGGSTEVTWQEVDENGTVIGSGSVGCDDGVNSTNGDMLVCLLARRPATALSVAERLVGRLISETPRTTGTAPPLEAVRDAYLAATPIGDLRTTVLAVVEHPDFLKAAFLRDKVKRPFAFVASLGRALGPRSEGPSETRTTRRGAAITNYYATFRGLFGDMAGMGEIPFWSPHPDGYPEESAAWAGGGALLRRWNAVQKVVDAHFDANPYLVAAWGFDPADADLGTEIAWETEIVDALIERLVPSGFHAEKRAAIVAEIADTGNFAFDDAEGKVRHATALILSSPEFLIY